MGRRPTDCRHDCRPLRLIARDLDRRSHVWRRAGAHGACDQRAVLDVSAGVLIGFGVAGCSFRWSWPRSENFCRRMAFARVRGGNGGGLVRPISLLAARRRPDGHFGWQQALASSTFSLLASCRCRWSWRRRSRTRRPMRCSNRCARRSPTAPTCCWCSAFSPAVPAAIHHGPCTAGLSGRSRPVGEVGGWTLATIGAVQHRRLGDGGLARRRMPKRYCCRSSIFVRAAPIFALHFVSGDAVQLHRVRRQVMGLMWLSTVPPTNGSSP